MRRSPLRRSTLAAVVAAALALTGAGSAGLAAPAAAADTAPNLLVNGDFEQPPTVGFVVYGAGSAGLPGWTIPSGSVETDGPDVWKAYSGSQSLNLDGNDPGTLQQTVTSTPGSTYHLSFAYSRHRDQTTTPAPFRVDVDGSSLASLSLSATGNPSSTASNFGYQLYDGDVTATGSSLTVRFASQSAGGSFGPVLDAVSLTLSTPAPSTLTGVALTADTSDHTGTPATTFPGADQVALTDVPLDRIPGSALDAVAAAPLRSVPLRSVPLRSVPLRSVPLRSVPLRSVPLRSVTLNQIPLVGSPTWSQVLAGTTLASTPPQDLTLDQVLALDAVTPIAGLAAVSLDRIDLSGSPLRSVSLASVYLGGVSLSDLTTTDGTTAYAAVCTASPTTCSSSAVTSTSPVLAADLAGVPLRSIPLRSVPLRSVPLRSVGGVATPLLAVPLRSVPLRSVPLRSVPLRSVDGLDVASAPTLAALHLSDLSPAAKILTDIQYASVAGMPGFPACQAAPCEYPTLAQAVTGGAAGSATLAQLAATGLLTQYTLGDLGPFDASPAVKALTIGDLLPGLAANVSVADALLSLIDASQIPWETISLDDLDLTSYATHPLLHYTATFALGGGFARDVDVTLHLPAGFTQAAPVTGLPEATPVEPVRSGNDLTWHLTKLPAQQVTLGLDVHPPLVLGSGTATLDVTSAADPVGGAALAGHAEAPVTVIDRDRTNPGDGESEPPILQPDTLAVGQVSASSRVTYLRVSVPQAGTRVSLLLSHLPIDADLVVYGPRSSAAQPTLPSAAPLRSVPLRSVPLPDPGVDATGALTPPPVLQDDVPRLAGRTVVGASAQRGTSNEEVDLLSPGTGGSEAPSYWTVQVSGYNGANSPQPWLLRVREIDPLATTCPARPYPAQVATSTAPTVPAGTQALFLVNRQQLVAEYGASDADAVIARATTLGARKDVNGVVVPVDTDPAVVDAYNRWNSDPCSIDAVNGVVGAASAVVLRLKAATPSITSVALLGGDEQLPSGRVPDLTSSVNERGFAPEDARADGSDNPFTAAQKAGYSLSDDPYGTTEAVPYLDRRLYVPTLAVGRLVETPAQMIGQMNAFVTAGGRVDPTSALTTGYDFLSDGATAVDAALATTLTKATGRTVPRSALISETWTRGDLLSRLLPSSGAAPTVTSINAHFDPSRALPAIGNSTGTESDLLTTKDLDTSGTRLAGALLFSMGCHAGLDVPAGYSGIAGAPSTADWPKELATRQSLWVANTGYGLGDTATVALSEALMRNVAQRLDGTLTAGQALAYAKQAYLGSLGSYGAADEKALQEIAYYGLPMWRVGGAASDGGMPVTLPPSTAPMTVTPAGSADGTGLPVVDRITSTTFTRTDVTGGGSFWSVGGENQTTAGTPIQPRSSLPATSTTSTQRPQGVLVTGLTSTDVGGVTPQFARAVLDNGKNEPAQVVPGTTSPQAIATLTSFTTPGGPEDRVVLVPGQFFSDRGQTVGTQRLFPSVGTRVYYGAGTATAPIFTTLGASRSGTTITFTTTVGSSDQTVTRVLVLVRNGGASTWTPVELILQTDGSWSGTLTGAASSIEWFAQAVGSHGGVGTSVNKGDLFGSRADFTVTPSGTAGQHGYYLSDVSIAVAGPSSRYSARIDGGPAIPVFGSVTVTTDGTHTVVVTGSSGESRTLTVAIDTTAPTVAVTDPVDGVFLLGSPARTATVTCDDGATGSGVASGCPAPFTVDTAIPGVVTRPVSVTDLAGNTTTALTYRVQYAFSGFDRPVSNVAINDAKAGSAVPFMFRLRSATGYVASPQALVSVSSVAIACPGTTGKTVKPRPPKGKGQYYDDHTRYYDAYDDGVSADPGASSTNTLDSNPSTNDPSSSLKVDKNGTYSYVWKTDKAWTGTCRTLSLTLLDGTSHGADFRFK